MNNQHKLFALAVAMTFACAGALALEKDQYNAAKARISADYKAAKKSCDSLQSNAKDICVSEARGTEKVAKADLEAQRKPSNKATYKVSEAKADAAYDTAKERCDDLAGNAKDVCLKDAKAGHVKAKSEAKVQLAANEVDARGAKKVADAQRDSVNDQNEANYKAAVERCDTFSGDVKDRCVNDTKARFGRR